MTLFAKESNELDALREMNQESKVTALDTREVPTAENVTSKAEVVGGASAEGTGKLSINYDSKIAKQMTQRGWTKDSIQQTIDHPARTVKTTDTRFRPDGTRNSDPATAYINSDGSYVVRNDRTGNIVQVSDRNDPNWKSPWGDK
ncbi:colicin E5-related ribonuclease [Sulfoacidibacillus thermotolerans]|uniref:Colicin E5 ribonuclease domain-containing protein n=1 Tax=Sulfoacidibacillus thermotolerans TaxID=1765684 RepID=A0A2U3D918_SULT2|nr:colicin E5-related ribonuclease [Sulfoacidibacillus thermotolerans]PWI57778.1 hypothetical protein BM613_07300 [Sulfoacidibacillus thermotolerans]